MRVKERVCVCMQKYAKGNPGIISVTYTLSP